MEELCLNDKTEYPSDKVLKRYLGDAKDAWDALLESAGEFIGNILIAGEHHMGDLAVTNVLGERVGDAVSGYGFKYAVRINSTNAVVVVIRDVDISNCVS